ncbi:class I SAM-dependent methyltransferase [Streptomyces sp. NPDC048718]|uniref:class I SAM-dependent methyltransferase n=1 Tax=Streptomyces sp. NPDC048718 TaxID=3365587 RepID=UPI003711E473
MTGKTPADDPRSFDRFARDYDRFVSLLPGRNTSWLLGLDPRGGRALDAGCGSGHAARALADRFDEVVGVDLSHPLIALAETTRAHPRVRYLARDLLDLTDPEGFDLVYSHTTLHHLDDYRAALEHLRSLVRPGGTVALVDNVHDRGPGRTPPRRAYTWPARWNFPRELLRLGPRDAWFQLRFWHSRFWLDHLLADRYLTRAEFRALYTSVFPGARFDDLGFALAMTWTAPGGAAPGRGVTCR